MTTYWHANANLRRVLVIVGAIAGSGVGLYSGWPQEALGGLFFGAIGGAILVRIVWYLADADKVW